VERITVGERVSILIIDDDWGMLQTLKYILLEKGYEVETTPNGFEAIERIKEKYFDIALIDIKMPGMNGVDVLKEIKELSLGTAKIIMTAFTKDKLVHKAKQEGAMAVISKPLDFDKLFALTQRTINRSTQL
jgi:DNA-binding NtrC family response regulator